MLNLLFWSSMLIVTVLIFMYIKSTMSTSNKDDFSGSIDYEESGSWLNQVPKTMSNNIWNQYIKQYN